MLHLEDKCFSGRIILKLIYSNRVEVYGWHLLESEREPIACFCEGRYESLVFTKLGEFLDYLNNSSVPNCDVIEYIY